MIVFELVKIFVLLVEERKLDFLRYFIEQVELGQTGYADPLLEHVDAMLLVEGKLPVNGL